MAVAPVYSLKHFLYLMEQLEHPESKPYPFYTVLLYAPTNGLDKRLHEYMTTHWKLMNSLTGYNCLLLAVEDMENGKPAIEDFAPEHIYDIARHLGQSPDTIPNLVFFVDPQHRNDTLVLNLGEFFHAGNPPGDNELTDFFRSIASIVDSCSEEPIDARLHCLQQRVDHDWPKDSCWAKRAREVAHWVVASTTTASTIVTALTPVLLTLRRIFGGF